MLLILAQNYTKFMQFSHEAIEIVISCKKMIDFFVCIGFGFHPERNDPLPFFQRYVVAENKRPPINYIKDDSVRQVIDMCWNKNPNDRTIFEGTMPFV